MALGRNHENMRLIAFLNMFMMEYWNAFVALSTMRL
jgi:hypothetical protein